jgi:uncharacterized protein (DUF2384 family)
MGQPLRDLEANDLLGQLRVYAAEVFGAEDAARQWLETPLWELDNLSPSEAVARNGHTGFDRARDVLIRIEYGVYS